MLAAGPEAPVRAARCNPARADFFVAIESLARHENFTLAGLARAEGGERRAVYVHAKTMLVDDAWVTIGSCNLHTNSLNGNTEMNASIWDPDVVRALRCELFAEHLGLDTSDLDDRGAVRLFRQSGKQSLTATNDCESKRRGLAIALRARDYAKACSGGLNMLALDYPIGFTRSPSSPLPPFWGSLRDSRRARSALMRRGVRRSCWSLD